MPNDVLAASGERTAIVMGDTGERLSFAELGERSCQLAHLLHAAGLRRGDHVALMMENHIRYFEVVFAALRSGLYVTPISRHLNTDEVAYIVEDCGADALITSATVGELAREVVERLGGPKVRLIVGATIDGFDRYEDAIAAQPTEPLDHEPAGEIMFYSSGTTGRPKGIVAPLSGETFTSRDSPIGLLLRFVYGMTDETVYLSPAPLYHAAPLSWTTGAIRLGATVVIMERFDAQSALALIEEHRVTHGQFVPTHFVRMLKLDPDIRDRYDVSSLQVAVHAAAPCPIEVKRQMFDWWGPILHEYYAGSEGNGFCAAPPGEWLAHPGTVGKPLFGTVHILDEDGNELGPGDAGQIWFESDRRFEYHNDPAKTAAAFNEQGFSTLGDVGYLDTEGYLYLTDRVSHMIISGGVNIYPQEVENLLSVHPDIDDVAVIGVPNTEMGEEVKAVIVPADPASAGDELAARLIAHCRAHLAHYKCPRSVDFVEQLPRTPTGKLLKRNLRDQYDRGR